MTNVQIARRRPCPDTVSKDELENIAWSSTRPVQTTEIRPFRLRANCEGQPLALVPRFSRSVRDRAPHGGSPSDLIDAMKAIIESSVAG